MRSEDILIVGAGPAGIAAAIQLQRSRVSFTLLEKDRVGGLLWNADLVENYPGFPNGISGQKLAGLFEKHLHRTGVHVTFDKVVHVNTSGKGFVVTTELTRYQPHYLIVATGTKPRPFPISIPEEVCDRIFSEIHPLLGIRDQHIVIVGAGDAAFDYALSLAKQNKISIFHRANKTSCLPLLWDRVMASKQITYQDRITIQQVNARKNNSKLLLTCQQTNERFETECDYLIYAIGRQPQLDLITPNLLSGRRILAGINRMHMVGDVVNGYLRQTAIAVGDGLRAAMQIYTHLTETETQT